MCANDEATSTVVRMEGKKKIFNSLAGAMVGKWCVWPLKTDFFPNNLVCSIKSVLLPTTPYFSWTRTPRSVVMGANNKASTTLVRKEGKENWSPIARLAKWMTNDVSGHSKLIFSQQCRKFFLLPTTPYFSWTRTPRKVVMCANDTSTVWTSTVVKMEGKENRSLIAWLAQWLAKDLSGL